MIKKLQEVEYPKIPNFKYGEVYSQLADNRVIFLNEEVSKESASVASALMLHYDHLSNEDPIYLYINTNGGDVSALLNIYDVMQMISAPISTICLGRAYSAGAVILAAGVIGHRFAMKHSRIMIHGIQFSYPIPGHDTTNSKVYFDFVKETNDNIIKILASHSGNEVSFLKKECEKDWYLSAQEAMKLGLIDGILD